jgi:tRNA acetyltransferase TAN1
VHRGADGASTFPRKPQLTRARSLQQFAIRTTIRNHHTLTRDGVIKQVANAVGDQHLVDLTAYDLLILVDIYKVRCKVTGMLDAACKTHDAHI